MIWGRSGNFLRISNLTRIGRAHGSWPLPAILRVSEPVPFRNRKRRQELTSPRWAALRRAVLERDGYRCVRCGKAGRLEVDHIVPTWRDHSERNIWRMEGLQALCRPCHFAKTRSEFNELRPPKPQRKAWRELVGELR